MFEKHEYSVVGHSRVNMGRYLGIIAGLLSSAVATLIAGLIAIAIAEGFTPSKQYYILPITSTVFYGLGYLIFDKYAWNWPWIQKIFNIPSVGGDWSCKGKTIDAEGQVTYEWSAKISIVQHWEKISVQIETAQSRSYSVAASIIKNENAGPILMYSYRNEPKPGEVELNSHFGYSEWHFSKDLKSAQATYVNGGGRRTSGIMEITKN
ncbi:pancortin-3 [Acidovorax sp. Root402]|uniref:Cap15 family cyclic dinucleotide receptor domain-containing protein n=1 Tax=Acidovorax sp. Root402 TaxID=1736527 RepID=UPI000AF1AA36|nr:pancortin-3 [Acidovorax sp. Root402]